MKKFLCAALILAFAASLCSCAGESRGSITAMDTYMDFKLYGDNSENALSSIKNTITDMDSTLSATDKNSEIYSLNKNGCAKLSRESSLLLRGALDLCEKTDGALDITVYPAVNLWGFISGNYKIPESGEIKKLLSAIDYKNVSLSNNEAKLKAGAQIELGAVAKGFAADKCREILKQNNVDSAILNFGGTIETVGVKPDGSKWKVAITDPDNTSEYFGYLSCVDAVVATSGGYERYFEKNGQKYIHIIDPKTGCPVNNGVKSVTIVADNGVYADALSTALYVMGEKKAKSFYKANADFDYILLNDKNELFVSQGIQDKFTVKDGYDFNIHTIKKG